MAVAVLKTAHSLALGNTVPHMYVLYDSFWLYIPLEIVKPVKPLSDNSVSVALSIVNVFKRQNSFLSVAKIE